MLDPARQSADFQRLGQGCALIGVEPRSLLRQPPLDQDRRHGRIIDQARDDQDWLRRPVRCGGLGLDRPDLRRWLGRNRLDDGRDQWPRSATIDRGRRNLDLHPRRFNTFNIDGRFAQRRGSKHARRAVQRGQGRPGRGFAAVRLRTPPDGEAVDGRPPPRRQVKAHAHAVRVLLAAQQDRTRWIGGPFARQARLQRWDRTRLARHQQGRDITDAGQHGRQVLAGFDPDDLDILADARRYAKGDHVIGAGADFRRTRRGEGNLALKAGTRLDRDSGEDAVHGA
ncbi:hypothetical protein D3C72_798050 [compost metagenome]